MRPARLGLARISVVRGEGPQAGTAAIDDYVRTLEPVTDYLTKWSGLVRATAPWSVIPAAFSVGPMPQLAGSSLSAVGHSTGLNVCV